MVDGAGDVDQPCKWANSSSCGQKYESVEISE